MPSSLTTTALGAALILVLAGAAIPAVCLAAFALVWEIYVSGVAE